MTLVFLTGLLAGCGGQDFSDLQAFMDEVDAKPKAPITPLPPFTQVEPFAYEASGLRSPFEPPVVVKPGPRPTGPQVKPNPSRVKQYLEQYTIASLSMVGTLSRGASMYALIQDADGGVHRVQPGDYMGTDHGKIQMIDESAIELIEIVPDGTGSWVERIRTVALGGGDRG
jgi:type IV pilus assembly protein PilP